MESLQRRIDGGEVILLDGAMGTELERRGAPMHGMAWSASALITHPDAVREVHEDYILAGADMITTNTFSTAPHVLEPSGMGDRVRELNTRAVTLAAEARENAAGGRRVCIAGSISTFEAGLDSKYRPPADRLQASYREQAALLAEAGVDLIAMEMMRDREQATYAVRAAVETGLPVWIGFSCKIGEDVMILDGNDRFASVLDAILPLGGAVVSVMHSMVEDVPAALRVVKENWSGPVGAYPHSGTFVMPNWQFEDVISPEDYVVEAQQWAEMGAQIVGGCCGIGPAHIRLLKERLPTHIPVT